MIICRNCGYQNLEGEMICQQCNQLMVEDVPTPRLNRPRTNELLAMSGYRLQNRGGETALVLNTAQLYKLREQLMGGRLVLGRAENNAQTTILRLNLPNAVDLGVSRSHAALIPRTDGIAVQDLGSTNGTSLNGMRLAELRAYLLQDGDLLSLGDLNLRVYLEN